MNLLPHQAFLTPYVKLPYTLYMFKMLVSRSYTISLHVFIVSTYPRGRFLIVSTNWGHGLFDAEISVAFAQVRSTTTIFKMTLSKKLLQKSHINTIRALDAQSEIFNLVFGAKESQYPAEFGLWLDDQRDQTFRI